MYKTPLLLLYLHTHLERNKRRTASNWWGGREWETTQAPYAEVVEGIAGCLCSLWPRQVLFSDTWKHVNKHLSEEMFWNISKRVQDGSKKQKAACNCTNALLTWFPFLFFFSHKKTNTKGWQRCNFRLQLLKSKAVIGLFVSRTSDEAFTGGCPVEKKKATNWNWVERIQREHLFQAPALWHCPLLSSLSFWILRVHTRLHFSSIMTEIQLSRSIFQPYLLLELWPLQTRVCALKHTAADEAHRSDGE